MNGSSSFRDTIERVLQRVNDDHAFGLKIAAAGDDDHRPPRQRLAELVPGARAR